MIGTTWRDSDGNKFVITFVDHNMEGSWVHYKGAHLLAEKEFSCLIDAFKERFTSVEQSR